MRNIENKKGRRDPVVAIGITVDPICRQLPSSAQTVDCHIKSDSGNRADSSGQNANIQKKPVPDEDTNRVVAS
jgi:hypothetical protein